MEIRFQYDMYDETEVAFAQEQSDDDPQEQSGTSGSRKREREPKLGARIFSRSELSTLRNVFIENPYPARGKYNVLAREFGKPRYKVRTWFNNERSRQRRLWLRSDNSSAGDSKPETEQNPDQLLSRPRTKLRRERHERAPPPEALRAVTLTVGSHILDGSEEHLLGNGLEIKFLFGRRRIVYEFCESDSVAEVYRQGGPFYRVEVLFDKIENITFGKDRASEVRLALNSLPEFSVQPASNFKAYRERKKQRLYVRREDKHLAKIFSESSEHIIRFQEPEKYLLVRSKLMKLEPELMRQDALARGSGSKTEKLTQDLELECGTPPNSVASEKVGLAASTGTTAQLASVKKSLHFEGGVSPNSPLYVPRLPPIQEGRAPAKASVKKSLHFEECVSPNAPLYVPRLPPIQEGRTPAKVERPVNSRLSRAEKAMVPES